MVDGERGAGRPGVRRSDRLRAWLDHVVAGGPGRVATGLVLVLVAVALLGALIRWGLGGSPDRFPGELWQAVTRLFDAGSHSGDVGVVESIVGVVLVFVGIVGSAVLLAIVVTAFGDVVERVRNGRSPLVEQPDTVILGWSHEIYTLIAELNASPLVDRRIAVLGPHQRVWMEDALARHLGRHRRRSRIACRTGDRTDPGDLGLVRVAGAERILVLADHESPNEGDLVKTVFALVAHGVDPERQRIIVEVADTHHERIFANVFGDTVEVVAAHDVITHVLTQSMRERGFGQIFDRLTSYQHADFYEHPLDPEHVGARFGDLLARCTDAIPVGLVRDGTSRLLPGMDSPVRATDRLLVLAEDDTPIGFDAPPDRPDRRVEPLEVVRPGQRVLLVGWNPFVDAALGDLRGFLGDDSVIDVIADATALSDAERRSLTASGHVDEVIVARSAVATLDAIRDRLAERVYDAVTVVPHRDNLDAGRADSRSLLYLAVVRDGVEASTTRVVVELRESRTETLVDRIEPDDLILSDALAASLMAQLTDRPWLTAVLRDLFDFHGSALFAHPVDRWGVTAGSTVRFDDIVAAAARADEIAVGYRRGTRVVLAPDRDEPVALDGDDAVYVLGPAVGWTGTVDVADATPPSSGRNGTHR